MRGKGIAAPGNIRGHNAPLRNDGIPYSIVLPAIVRPSVPALSCCAPDKSAMISAMGQADAAVCPAVSLRAVWAADDGLDLFSLQGKGNGFWQEFCESRHGVWLCLIIILSKGDEVDIFRIQKNADIF